MTKNLLNPINAIILSIVLLLTACQSNNRPFERNINFNHDWKFINSDIASALDPSFDDSSWRIVNLPHDIGVEDLAVQDSSHVGPFRKGPQSNGAVGFLKGGTAWYRKHFTVKTENADKQFIVGFDGIQSESKIYVNGHKAAENVYGYTPFNVDITPFIKAGEDNVIAVRVFNPENNSRWYAGFGIYRDVKLSIVNKVHVVDWNVFITTPKIDTNTAKVNVALKVINATKNDENITIATTLIAPDNSQSNTEEQVITIPHDRNKDISFDINVINPQLWDMNTPQLYLAKIQIFKDNEQIDEYTTKFGIRSIEFSATKGFLLNGKSVLLKGGCMHHDNGLLGAAAFKKAEYRKVDLMKKNGFNSIRTSHNPVSTHFLNACDELGVLVIEEAFDQWEEAKTDNDYHRFFDKNWEGDITAMVTRDRNHPSIIMWSMGNEIPERGRANGVKTAKMIGDKIRSLDATRPNTQAIFTFWEDSNKGLTWEKDTPAAFAVTDIAGYNYNSFNYEPDHKKYPNRIMYSSESYPYNAYVNWQLTEKLPYVIGDFVWTGMDYIGEAGIGISKYVTKEVSLQHPQPWPWFNGYCGDIDLIGNKKPQGYFRDVVWGESKAEILVHEPIPAGKWEQVHRWGWPKEEASWTWPEAEGKTLNVNVYTKYPNVDLFLNGKLIGKQSINLDQSITASFKVPYQAGELKAICTDFNGGKIIKVLKTAGEVTSLKLVAESDIIENNTDEIAYIRVSAIDKDGNLVPNCSIPLNIDITGPATVIGAGSSYPKIKGSLQDNKFFLYRGQGLVIIRSTGEKGDIDITISDFDKKIIKDIQIKAYKK